MTRTEPANRVSLSVIMIGLNEGANIRRAVETMRDALDECSDEFEIIVIDDGSHDDTGEIADRLGAENTRIRAFHNPVNVNYGVSLQRGIAVARCDWILHVPMDLPLAPSDLPAFFGHFSGADVVVARRVDRSANSTWRRLTSWVNNLLLRALFQPKCADLNFVQFYRRAWVQSISARSTSPAAVTPELILTAEHTGRQVREVEVEFRRRLRGRAHFGRPRDILWTLRDLGAMRLRTWLRGWQRTDGREP